MFVKSVNNLIGNGFGRKFYSFYVNTDQINQSELTEMAWEGLVDSIDAAWLSKQQIVESE